MSGFATINGVNRSLGDGWATINGVCRKIKGGWETKNGVWQQVLSSGLALLALPVGSLIKLNESGSGVNFYLAKHDYESSLNGAGRSLLVRKDCYDKRVWDSDKINAYADSDIDIWFNGNYKALLDTAVQELIGETTFYRTIGNGNYGVTTLTRAVFALSLTEYGLSDTYATVEGSSLPIASNLKIAYLNGTAVQHWTRTPKTNDIRYAWYVNIPSGTASNTLTSYAGVSSRPCFTLPATAMVNPTPNADGSYTLLV